MTKPIQQKNKKTNSGLWVSIKKIKWYIKIPLVLLLLIVSFQALRSGVNAYNVSLLDKAERKMRSLVLPQADSTTYKRDCSFKSTQNLWSGFPICRVTRNNVYLDTNQLEADRLTTLFESSLGYAHKNKASGIPKDESGNGSIILNNFQEGLACFGQITFRKGLYVKEIGERSLPREDEYRLVLSSTCQKRTVFQLYPES